MGLLVLPDPDRVETPVFEPGQRVRANLAGMMVGSVTFHSAVTDAIGTIVKQTSPDPPKYLIELMFSIKGINKVEVPEERLKPM